MLAANYFTTTYEQLLGSLLREVCNSFSMVSPSERVIIDPKKAVLLQFLVKEGYFKRDDLTMPVHARLLELGEMTFKEHRNTEKGIDNCLRSHRAFGYALKHERVDSSEVKFDHDETAEEYIKFAEGLLPDVIEQLLSYQGPPQINPTADLFKDGSDLHT